MKAPADSARDYFHRHQQHDFIFQAVTTFTPCLSMGLLNSHLATSFSPIDGFHTSR